MSVKSLLEADRLLYASGITQEEFNPLNQVIYSLIKLRLLHLLTDQVDGLNGFELFWYLTEQERSDLLFELQSHEGNSYTYEVDGVYVIIHVH